jgi:ferredoxin
MIVAEQKPLEQIKEMLAPYERVLIVGCGTCVTVCFAGGSKEVEILASLLRMSDKLDGGPGREYGEATVQRQCEWEYLDALKDRIGEYDAVLSLGCGVGVQAIAEHFPDAVVLPGLNTSFLGLPVEHGVWAERCAACGDCILDKTGGICPIARCAKQLLNGPCGGSQEGKCEVSKDTDCAWALIIERMTRLGRLEELLELKPPKNWSTSRHGGPRRIAREDLMVMEEA